MQVCRGPRGSGPRAASHPPPPRPHAHAGRECADDTRGARTEYRRPPPRRGVGRPRRDPPPHPPHRPASRGGPGPQPPRQGGWSPSPPERGAGAQPAPPAPAAGSHRGRGEQASPHQRARTPHRSRPEKTGEHEPEWYGGPPALQPPPGRTNRGYGARSPPPSPPPGTRTPWTRPAARSPHRACRPRGQRRAPTPARLRPQHVGSGPQEPAQWAGSQGRGSA